MVLKNEETRQRVELLMYYRTEIRHEYDLITSRVGAFITAQSFLMTVTGITLSNIHSGPGRWPLTLFIGVVCALGMASCYFSRIGILAAIETAALWSAKKNLLFLVDPGDMNSGVAPEMAVWRIERPIITIHGQMGGAVEQRSLLFPKRMPALFFAGWVVVAGLTVMRFFLAG